jgi:hypothetical protein
MITSNNNRAKCGHQERLHATQMGISHVNVIDALDDRVQQM